MKKITLLISAILLIMVFFGLVCLADAPDSTYELVLSDEFDSTDLNTEIWAYRTGNPYGGKNLQENVRVSDGKLYIDYRKVDGYYTGGGVLTLANFPYGYYETKAKVYTGANGFHTSFWTSGGQSMSHKSLYHPQYVSVLEIDGFEFDSNETTIAPKPAYNLHYWWADHKSIGGTYYDCDTDGNTSTSDWFTMGIEWLPGQIIFYCNGEQVGTAPSTVFNPSALWLTAVAMPENYKNSDGTYSIDDTKMDSNGYFGSSEYEYFRYYSKKLKGVNLLGNGHFELNRQTTMTYPRAFYSTGAVKTVSTPLANSGAFAIQMLSGSTTGQELQYLAGGNYTFEGHFKTNSYTKARLVVYGKDGLELKALNIPSCENWTKVSLTDVAVETYAYVVVEVTEGEMMVDDLSFYCQEGETGYENYRDTDYEKYTAFKSSENSAIIIDASQTTRSDSGWESSTITDMNNLYSYAYKSSFSNNYYKNIYANWEYAFTKDKSYDVEIYQITDEKNTASQNYTVTLDGVTIVENVSVTTRDATRAGAWVKICSVNAKAGQVLKVSMTVPKHTGTTSRECVRITPLRFWGHDEKVMDTAFVAQIARPVYQYKNMPYAFDVNNLKLCPNKKNGEIYIPYQAIKTNIRIPGVDDNAEYISATEVNASGIYKLTVSGSYVIIYEQAYTPNESGIKDVISNFDQRYDDFCRIAKEATYVGTSSVTHQEVYDINTAELSTGWGTSSLGYNSDSRYGRDVTALWEISPEHAGWYSVQFYSIVHPGGTAGSMPSTTAAGVDFSVHGKTYTYRFDQCNGTEGWYDLGEFNMEKGDSFFISLYNEDVSGLLRANAVRLVPADEPEFVGDTDVLIQEYFGPETAVKNGEWAYSSGVYAGCMYAQYTSDNKDASITWSTYPKTTDTYSIQIYVPKFTQTATSSAKIDLKINDKVQSYYVDERADGEESTGSGWYTLGNFTLSETDFVSVAMTNHAQEQCIRAKAVRLIPVNLKPAFVGNFDEINQELHSYSSAIKTGTWMQSGATNIEGTFYGKDNPTITWTPVPAATQKYSIQVYIPTYLTGSATDAYVTLTIDGLSHTFNGINQVLDPTVGTGWYDLGVYDLSPASEITVVIGKNDGVYVRVKDMRLVPFPNTVLVTKSSTSVTINLGTLSNYAGTVIFAEYDSKGVMQSIQIHDTAPILNITRGSNSNDFKLFFWKGLHSMIPIIPAIEN